MTYKRHHYNTLFNRGRENKTVCLWKPGNVGIQQVRDEESRKDVPVPDQKGEEEGGTKLQPPRGTTRETERVMGGGFRP